MNNIEKILAEKFMYTAYIKDDKNIFEDYCKYIKYVTLLKDRKDKDLLNKVNDIYRDYFKDKSNKIK